MARRGPDIPGYGRDKDDRQDGEARAVAQPPHQRPGQDGAGGMASFEVKGQAADVIAHFRKQAEAAGMKITTEVKAGETAMFGAERPGDSKSGVQVTATQAGDMVNGSITYGHGG